MSPRVNKHRLRAVARYALMVYAGTCTRCPADAQPGRKMCRTHAREFAAKQTARNQAKSHAHPARCSYCRRPIGAPPCNRTHGEMRAAQMQARKAAA